MTLFDRFLKMLEIQPLGAIGMAEVHRYAAFISYSSKDASFAKRLHRALENYAIPSSAGQVDLVPGGKRNRIYPVFRDRDGAAAGRLWDVLNDALKASYSLIVVCSPNSSLSTAVEREIRTFIDSGPGRKSRVFAIIASDAPLEDDSGDDATPKLFPVALPPDATLAADARKGKDGLRMALLKIVAGIASLSPDKLINRDNVRRRRQLALGATAACAAIAILAISAALVDTHNWRSRLVAYATSANDRGLTSTATTFALAAEPAAGDLLTLPEADARFQLLRTGATLPVQLALGDVKSGALISSDRLLVSRSNGEVELFDVVSGEATAFGKAKNVGYSPDGRYVYVITENDSLVVRRSTFEIVASIADVENARFLDGKDLLVLSKQEEAAIYDLDAGTTEWIGSNFHGVSPDNRFALLISSQDNASLKSIGTGAEVALGDYFRGEFSPNGRYLFLDSRSGDDVVLEISSGRRVEIGDTGAASTALFSADSRFLLAETEERIVPALPFGGVTSKNPIVSTGRFKLVTLQTGAVEIRAKGGYFSDDGRYLLTYAVGAMGVETVQNLATGKVEQYRNNLLSISSDGRWLLIETDEREFELVDLTSDQREKLGTYARARFTSDGKFLETLATDGNWALLDLVARTTFTLGAGPSEGRWGSGYLAAERNFANISPDGRFALRRTANETMDLQELTTGGRSISLGKSVSADFTADSRFVLVRTDGGLSTLINLPRPSARLATEVSREQICQMSAHALFPFEWAVRTGSSPESSGVHQILLGRPWNPCDWRGLAFGPEGWAQWTRRLVTANFGQRAKDYKCGEINAEGQTSNDRLRMCQLAGVPANWIAPPNPSRPSLGLDSAIQPVEPH